jgi:DNA-binding transcriptional ArsR family regulator
VVGLDEASGANVHFAAGALVELGNVLHAVLAPEHHEQGAQWAATPAVAELLPALRRWAFVVRAIRARMFIDVSIAGRSGWDSCLEAVQHLDAAEMSDALLRPLGGRAGAERYRGRDSLDAATVAGVLADPQAAREQFIALLQTCWEQFFGAWWKRRGAVLADEVLHRRQVLHRQGLSSALRDLPGISHLGDGTVVLDKVRGKRLSAADRPGLVLMPSTVVAPHLYLADEPSLPITVIYPLTESPPVVAGVLHRRLQALAHPERLQVARAIATEARSASEISRLWPLQRSRVARHLRTLHEAGLATRRRNGRSVLYRLDLTVVDALGTDLSQVLLR